MFQRILIANRGEIALRVIRACKELGIESVGVYSEEDSQAIYLRFADETLCIGPSGTSRPYLDIPTLIAAAEIANVDAIHPGYGFLAENAHFAEICQSCNLKFIGPTPETIGLLGNKAKAREVVQKVGVPVVPGSSGLVADEEKAISIAGELGFPVLIKASAGGGGRGMRIAQNEADLRATFQAAKSEAQAAFKNGDLYVEKLIERPRHVEIQILGDQQGNVVFLGERDCSLQRRHQKLVEESPSPAVDPDLRRRMGEAAVRIAKAVGYEGAGTVEFLLAPNGDFYFIEVNARIQVEHPVTEEVTNLDLIKEQIRVAAGEPLSFTQEDVKIEGHAIECRINAEDPERNFSPSPGKIDLIVPPGGRGVRWDSHTYSGYRIPSTFDSLVGKLIVKGRTREEALALGRRALDEFVIEGIKTTIPLHRKIFEHTDFVRGIFDTGFIDRYFSSEA